jgi:hypothetical protein
MGIVLLAGAPVLWKVLTIVTVNTPVDTTLVKSSVGATAFLFLTAALAGILGLIRDRKKVVAGFALLLSVVGGFYMAEAGLFSIEFWR